MYWHQSKFWRSMVVAGIAVSAGLVLKLDSRAQTDKTPIVINDSTTANPPNVPMPPNVPNALGAEALAQREMAQAAAAGAPAVALGGGSRLDALVRGGFIPWDTARGIFITLSDTGDRITVWELGTDWSSAANFNVARSRVIAAGQ